jgi:hypothetical protein
MLFRTVYGLELQAIYELIWSCNQVKNYPTKEDIYHLVFPVHADHAQQITQPVDDALSFLHSAGMLSDGEELQTCFDPNHKAFHLRLLEQLVRIWKGSIPPVHPLDPLFFQLLDELFISTDILFIANVFQEANRIKTVREAGGISNEKIQAWKRVLEFLGIGLRIQSGFLCTYSPTILRAIISSWNAESGALQDFLENYFSCYLPFSTKAGEIAKAASIPFKVLEKEGFIELVSLQDSPTHFYFGDQKLRGITRKKLK